MLTYAVSENVKSPNHHRATFCELAAVFAERGDTLRVGAQENIENAFLAGARNVVSEKAGAIEVFIYETPQLPPKEAERSRYIDVLQHPNKANAMGIVESALPWWQQLLKSDYDQAVVDTFKILGEDLTAPVDVLYCYNDAEAEGFPDSALTIARASGVRCVNLGNEKTLYKAQDFSMFHALRF